MAHPPNAPTTNNGRAALRASSLCVLNARATVDDADLRDEAVEETIRRVAVRRAVLVSIMVVVGENEGCGTWKR